MFYMVGLGRLPLISESLVHTIQADNLHLSACVVCDICGYGNGGPLGWEIVTTVHSNFPAKGFPHRALNVKKAF